MEEISAAILKKSLDGLAMRYAFSAQNVANANSPGYQPVKVMFEDALRAAADLGPAAVGKVRIEAISSTALTEPGMRLDLELADASQTALRYRAMIDILGRELALQRAVVSQGTR